MRRLFLRGFLIALLVQVMGKVAMAEPMPRLSPLLGFHVARGDSAHLSAAAEAGAAFAVLVFSWQDIEPTPGYFYWEVPDAALRAADYHGVEILARLDRPPDWAVDEQSLAPWSLDAYAQFVHRVVERYGHRLGGVIVWNEPNLALEWHDTTPDPAAYAAMLARVYPVVKAVAPDLPVIAAGLAFTAGDTVSAINDLDYLSALYAAGAAVHFDILAAHPYGFGRPPADPPRADRLNMRRLELYRAIMEAAGDGNKPIWITEMGWRTAAPVAADRWQVVTPAQQRVYTLLAIDWLAQYAWLDRLAFWEINGVVDNYGYALWQGPTRISPAYAALVARRSARKWPTAVPVAARTTLEILAPDVAIRLGDRGELHPHWVHLHRGGEHFTPDWNGEFFLDARQARSAATLLLETMQVDQPGNRVVVNNVPIGLLQPRARPDPTSTWATQRLTMPPGLLRPGVNRIAVLAGPRNPARLYSWWQWENFQFRNVRLEPATRIRNTGSLAWSELPAPEGWLEVSRLRAGASAETFWLTGNRPGQLWRGVLDATDALELSIAAGNRPDLLFQDVAARDSHTLAATDQGLFWRSESGDWQPADGVPPGRVLAALNVGATWYAGTAGDGVWQAAAVDARWQPMGLAGRSVYDLAVAPDGLVAATDAGIFVATYNGWDRLPSLPPADQPAAAVDFVSRLFIGSRGELLVRSENRLLRWDRQAQVWEFWGPPELQGRMYALAGCCGPGTLAGSYRSGLWELQADGVWRRSDGGVFEKLELTAGIIVSGYIVWATTNGLFWHNRMAGFADAGAWQSPAALPSTVTDLLIDPTAPRRWLAGTPAGVFRSEDAGQTWRRISPPWIVWSMVLGGSGRLFLARADGVAWTDDLGAETVRWQETNGLSSVTIFTLSLETTVPERFWAGTWGNDIGVSNDGGVTMNRLGNGLETLSVLAILRHPTPEQVTVGTIEGLYRSDDGGATWFKLPGALSRQTIYALHQDDDGTIWAGSADGLWQSRDYGVSWARMPGVPPVTVLRLGTLDSAKGPLFWAGTEGAGLWWSRDRGQHWYSAGLDARTVYALLADPTRPGHLIAATDHGLAGAAAD